MKLQKVEIYTINGTHLEMEEPLILHEKYTKI